MKQVFQTDTTNTTGNCLQACVASILDLTLNEVPSFPVRQWREDYYDFMRHYGWHVVSIPVVSNAHLTQIMQMNWQQHSFCILAVKSFKHENTLHAVVGEFREGDLEIVHDPNAEYAMRPTEDYVIVELDLFYRRYV